MDVSKINQYIQQSEGMATCLGMTFLSTPEPDTCKATMPVDGRTCQPYGYLSGGASLALAEIMAGVGSQALCPDMMCLGVSVSGQHVKTAPKGQTVTATARLVHGGRTLHVWQVTVTDEAGETLSTISVTNCIVKPREQ